MRTDEKLVNKNRIREARGQSKNGSQENRSKCPEICRGGNVTVELISTYNHYLLVTKK